MIVWQARRGTRFEGATAESWHYLIMLKAVLAERPLSAEIWLETHLSTYSFQEPYDSVVPAIRLSFGDWSGLELLCNKFQ